MLETMETPVAPRRSARKMIAHANTVRAGTSAVLRDPKPSRPSVTQSCTADLAKNMIRREFQPMMETACRAAGTTQPRHPNCGLVAAMESMPNRTQAGPEASSTKTMPIMQPAPRARPPLMKPR